MDGIINVYKEKGWTSFDVTKRLRAILHEKKIGHTGTLDPMAEGVLVVCAGKATKLVSDITGTDKVYEAEFELGLTSDTEDSTGTILTRTEPRCTEAELRAAVQSMVGEYEQIPPMYSAKKINGQKLYDIARKGRVVERKPVKITIFAIDILEIKLPRVRISVRCGKGTYIRTLCADIGMKLGCGAVMTALKRTRVGAFEIRDSLKLSALERLSEEGRLSEALLPPVYVPVPTVACFGKFDGGHRGHQIIFEEVFRIAKEKNLKTAVLTFSQNPANLVKNTEHPVISTAAEHLTRLRNQGFDYLFEFPMTQETMCMPPETFLERVLVNGLHAVDIVVGTDCSFGYKAEGNAALLEKDAARFGYTVHVLKKREVTDEAGNVREISSSFIKEEIGKGNVRKARELLGRYFSMAGVVVHGKKLGGAVLGFPTANIVPSPGKSLPAAGVYVSRVLIDQKLYAGMTNVGTNPTVSEGNPVDIETHVLDYSGDLYGKKIRVDFVDRIRDQQRFPSLEDLKAQLEKDVAITADYFEKNPLTLGS